MGTTFARRLAMALALAPFAAALLAACATHEEGAPPAAVPASTVAVPPAPDDRDASPARLPGASPSDGAFADAGPTCGCALCEPVVSDDACVTDADCAPDVPCHAPRCVAKARAEPRRPGQACTMSLVCTSADANACGCVAHRCTLHARDAR